MQPDVYCRRLNLQVPVAVNVKTDRFADVFHAICGVAMHPYVKKCSELTAQTDLLTCRMSAAQKFFNPWRRRAKFVTCGAVTHLHRVFGACGRFFGRGVVGISNVCSAGDSWWAVVMVAAGWSFTIDRADVE